MKIASPLIAALLLLFVGIYVAGRLALYRDFPYFDSVLHVLGGAIAAWIVVAYAAQRRHARPTFSTVLLATLIIGLGWELAEFLSGLFLKGTLVYRYFHGGDRLDTLSDVIMDVIGGTIAFGRTKALHSFQGLDAQKR